MPVSPPEASPGSGTFPGSAPSAGFGIYVHWPFCLAKCPYCDFNSHVRDGIDQARWARALCAELDHFAALAPGRTVTSVFFGGGTPSLMRPATVAAVIDRIAGRWPLAADAEISLEANPTSAEAERFAGFAAAGVNRLSLGVQALDDDALRRLGRRHDVAEALAAVELARRHARRISFDLIYARPGQNVAAWRDELGRAVALAADHLSLYQLTVERGTAFHGLRRQGALVLPDEGTASALYDATQEICDAAGLSAYEVSNHARPGAECRHNLTYWRYDDYVGVGPGAHGRLSLDGRRLAMRQSRRPEAWLGAVERQGHGGEAQEAIDAGTAAEEMLMMGLRLTAGVDLDSFRARVGRSFQDMVAAVRLERMVSGGLLILDGERLRATARGRVVLDAVLAELLA